MVYANNPIGSKELIRAIGSQAESMTIVNINRHSYKQVEVSITGYFVGFLIEVGWFVLLVTSFKSRALGVIFLFYRCLNLAKEGRFIFLKYLDLAKE